MSEYDVTSARARVASRQENVITAERQVLDTQNALKQLISDNHTTGLLDEPISIEPPAPAPIVVVDPVADFGFGLPEKLAIGF